MCNFHWNVVRYVAICITTLYFLCNRIGKKLFMSWYILGGNIWMDIEMMNKGFKCPWTDNWMYKKLSKEIAEHYKFRAYVSNFHNRVFTP